MRRLRKAGVRASGLAGIVAAVLLIAACGGGKSSSSSQAGAGTPAPSNAGGVTISTAKGPLGTYLTDSAGRPVYLFMGDSGGMSNCSGSCTQEWPPLTTSSAATAGSGLAAADIGTITRSDGAKEVTYKGHPLYYFAGDSGPGKPTGQGLDDFGAKWWIVAPSGTAILKSSGQASSSPRGY
jgi:predicted lipoprotein with Yx(FWY)xxD motif